MPAAVKARTPRGPAEANAEESTDARIIPRSAEEVRDSKRKANLTAMFALRGFTVHEITTGGFLVGRWNLTRHCADLDALEEFARRVGAAE